MLNAFIVANLQLICLEMKLTIYVTLFNLHKENNIMQFQGKQSQEKTKIC